MTLLYHEAARDLSVTIMLAGLQLRMNFAVATLEVLMAAKNWVGCTTQHLKKRGQPSVTWTRESKLLNNNVNILAY